MILAVFTGLATEVQGGTVPERSDIGPTTQSTTVDERDAPAPLDSGDLGTSPGAAVAELGDSHPAIVDPTDFEGAAIDGPGPASAAVGVDHPAAPAVDGTRPGPRPPSGLEPLVPEMAGRTFALAPGPRAFRHRLAFSPGFGRLGQEPLYLFRVAWNPNAWLGWEAHLGHNRGRSVHALFHMLNAQVRYPVPFRLQPYLTGGFGVVLVFPGHSLNADPVTENALAGGGGLELYLRDDLAIRGEWRRISVFARDRYTTEDAVYSYDEATIGLSFYRTIGGS